MVYVQLLLGWFWKALPQDMFELLENLPDAMHNMFALFGGGDIGTPAGWFQIETFGMMAPVMIMIVTISIGANALAGEEGRRTMGLLMSNPISRSRIIVAKSVTMFVYATLVGVVSFLGTWAGVWVGDMDLPLENIAAICVLLVGVGMVGGTLALAIGAGTGRKSAAVWGAVGFMGGTHVMNSMGEIADNPAWQKLSPFYYYLGGDPLNNGLAWGDVAVLAAIAVVFFGAAIVLFQRRDIREGAE
jgi:ABC-2 type transport system permease protein